MKGLLIAAVVLVVLALGKLFVILPAPVIVVAPETIFHAGDLAITNTMFTSWVVVILIALIAILAGRGVRLVPSGFSAYVEAAVMALYGIVEQVAGSRNGRRFFPLIGTIFFTILFANYFGLLPINNVIGRVEPNHGDKQVVFQQTSFPLIGDVALIPMQSESRNVGAGDLPLLPEGVELEHEGAATGSEGHGALIGGGDADLVSAAPGGSLATTASGAESGDVERSTDGSFSGLLAPAFRSVNTDVNAPLAIAIFSFIFVEFWGLQTLGPGYLKKFFAVGAFKKGPMGVIDIFVGLLELVSELSRTVSFTFRLFGNIFAGEVLLLMMTFLVPLLLVDVFYGLELFVGLIQAFVFAMLTLVFAVTAVSHHGDDHPAEHHEEHAPAH